MSEASGLPTQTFFATSFATSASNSVTATAKDIPGQPESCLNDLATAPKPPPKASGILARDARAAVGGMPVNEDAANKFKYLDELAEGENTSERLKPVSDTLEPHFVFSGINGGDKTQEIQEKPDGSVEIDDLAEEMKGIMRQQQQQQVFGPSLFQYDKTAAALQVLAEAFAFGGSPNYDPEV